MTQANPNISNALLIDFHVLQHYQSPHRQYGLSLNESVVLLFELTEVSSHRAVPWRQLRFASSKLHCCMLGKRLILFPLLRKEGWECQQERGAYEASSYCLLCWYHNLYVLVLLTLIYFQSLFSSINSTVFYSDVRFCEQNEIITAIMQLHVFFFFFGESHY